ncbi:CPBP family intramembrane metalloprotease [Candidatus Micrarchaeota archaeon]|nr:CPBP family intramembrane metalloprotease [Candidatus Micrarchaeota archaeon]
MIPLSLLLFFAPFVLLALESKTLKQSISFLGFNSRKPFTQIGSGLLLVGFCIVILIFEGVVLNALGFLDTNKIAEFITSQPAWLLAAAIIAAPVAEETFFRGYLQKKTGVVLSSMVFAALHFGYGSVTEVVAAFSVSIVLGWWVRKNKLLLPAIVAHAAYNALSIALVLSGIAGA